MTIKVTWAGDEEKHRMLDWGGVVFAPGKAETLPDGFDANILAKMRKSPLFEVVDGDDKGDAEAKPAHPGSAAAKVSKA